MELDDLSFVVIDVETTGLSAAQHRITDIAMLRVERGKIVDTFEALVNPEQYISPFIAEYTGITNAMVFGKPTFADTAEEIKRFIAKSPDAVLVGHNVNFDHGFLTQSLSRAGHSISFIGSAEREQLLCTCRLAGRLLPKLQRRTLKHVADFFGIRIKQRHRAMGDAEATARILIQFLEMARDEMHVETLEELLTLQYKKPPKKGRVTKKQISLKELVHTFPERPGVYTMTDTRGAVIYIGKAKSLRDRVSSYFNASATRGTKYTEMMKAVRDITYEETGSELSALLLESRKIKELKPRYNAIERRYKNYTFLKLSLATDFPKLDWTKEPKTDGSEYYGPFRSRATVEALIEVLNRSFQLRECGDEFRVGKEVKPCFYFEINRCNAPCALKETKAHYGLEVERLRRFLANGEDGVIAMVEQMMRDAADRLDFEEAQFLKIRLLELRRVLSAGERELVSMNANDFVIMTLAKADEAEIYFVRFGKLVKQITLNQSTQANLEEWFYRQLRMYFGTSASAIPPECSKDDVDEMRILSHWCDMKKRKGSAVVYVEGSHEDLVPRLARELQRIWKGGAKPKEPESFAAASRSLAVLNEGELSTAKRLTLKPMMKRV